MTAASLGATEDQVAGESTDHIDHIDHACQKYE